MRARVTQAACVLELFQSGLEVRDAGWDVFELLRMLGCGASYLDAEFLQPLKQIDIDGADDSALSIKPVEIIGLFEHRLCRSSQASIEETP